MNIPSDDRLGMNFEDLLKLSQQLDDTLVSMIISFPNQGQGLKYSYDDGIRFIRNQHTMYPKNRLKHPVWIAYGEKYLYFMSTDGEFCWLNYIPLLSECIDYQPEIYGLSQR